MRQFTGQLHWGLIASILITGKPINHADWSPSDKSSGDFQWTNYVNWLTYNIAAIK